MFPDIMKRRRYAVMALAACILIAGCVWLLMAQHDTQPEVTVAFLITNSSLQQASFRIYNDSPREIFLSWMVVETKEEKGWKLVSKAEPRDPRVVGRGKSMDLLVSLPSEAKRCRFTVIYGTENRGPALLLTRVELGVRNRSVSGLGSVGVFTGQKSVVTEVSR